MGSHSERPNIVFASANVADPRYRPLFLVNPARVGRFATAAGFDGVEWHPAFDWIATPRAIARAVEAGHLNLESLHAAFRATRRSQDVNETPETRAHPSIMDRVVATPIGRLVMPEIVNSSRFLGRVQRLVGERACVMYPLSDPALDERARKTAGPGLKLIQPTDRVAQMYGARTPEEFVEKVVHKGGYDGFVADTVHMNPLRYAGLLPKVVSDLDRSLPVLQPYIVGAHPAFGRVDIARDNEPFRIITETDLALALKGIYTGPTGDIMAAAWEAPYFHYAALETTASSLGDATKDHSYQGLVGRYQDLAAGLHNYQPGSAAA